MNKKKKFIKPSIRQMSMHGQSILSGSEPTKASAEGLGQTTEFEW